MSVDSHMTGEGYTENIDSHMTGEGCTENMKRRGISEQMKRISEVAPKSFKMAYK